MGRRTLIIGPSQTGKTALASERCRQGAWFLNLDPARQSPNPPGCASLYGPGMAPMGFRFIGSLTPSQDPLAAMEALAWAADQAGDLDLVVEWPVQTPTSLHVHVSRAVANVLEPTSCIAIGIQEPQSLLQLKPGCEVQSLEPDTAPLRSKAGLSVRQKAAWATAFEGSQTHEVSLEGISVMGARFGSGLPLEPTELAELRDLGFISAHYAEVAHNVLYVVTPGWPGDETVSLALRHFACATLVTCDPQDFAGIVCGLEDRMGTCFALGLLVRIDFDRGALILRSPAEAPLPVHRVRLGRTRLGEGFQPIGELRPWQV